MKSFTFVDLDGKKHCLPPSFFASSTRVEGLEFLYPLSDSVVSELSEYATKAHRATEGGNVSRKFLRPLLVASTSLVFVVKCKPLKHKTIRKVNETGIETKRYSNNPRFKNHFLTSIKKHRRIRGQCHCHNTRQNPKTCQSG